MERGSTWTSYSRSPSERNLVTQHFGSRGRQENYDLRVEHFKFAKDENGRTYITFADSNPTKTRKSSIKLQRRMVIPRMVATGGERFQLAFLKNLSAADQVILKRTVHCNLQLTTSQSPTFGTKHKGWIKERLARSCNPLSKEHQLKKAIN